MLATQREKTRDKQYEIYMPNANPTLARISARIGHYRFALGIIHLRWGVALGLQGFLDTNLLVSAT